MKLGDNNNILRTIPQEKDYPLDPNTIPVPPSSQQPGPQVTLSELIPGEICLYNSKSSLFKDH
jgi:hypothetical protein